MKFAELSFYSDESGCEYIFFVLLILFFFNLCLCFDLCCYGFRWNFGTLFRNGSLILGDAFAIWIKDYWARSIEFGKSGCHSLNCQRLWIDEITEPTPCKKRRSARKPNQMHTGSFPMSVHGGIKQKRYIFSQHCKINERYPKTDTTKCNSIALCELKWLWLWTCVHIFIFFLVRI